MLKIAIRMSNTNFFCVQKIIIYKKSENHLQLIKQSIQINYENKVLNIITRETTQVTFARNCFPISARLVLDTSEIVDLCLQGKKRNKVKENRVEKRV